MLIFTNVGERRFIRPPRNNGHYDGSITVDIDPQLCEPDDDDDIASDYFVIIKTKRRNTKNLQKLVGCELYWNNQAWQISFILPSSKLDAYGRQTATIHLILLPTF